MSPCMELTKSPRSAPVGVLHVLSVVLSLFGLFFVHLLLGLRRAARDVGNLSGPFFLFHPLSALGFLLGQTVRKIPYLSAGNAWGLNEKHDDFATAGQDGFAL
ncbi:hypothetical protein V8E52_007254 [Russula decolorans]